MLAYCGHAEPNVETSSVKLLGTEKPLLMSPFSIQYSVEHSVTPKALVQLFGSFRKLWVVICFGVLIIRNRVPYFRKLPFKLLYYPVKHPEEPRRPRIPTPKTQI